MLEIIICITTNLFRIYLIHRFIKIFVGDFYYDNRRKKLLVILVYGSYFLINTTFYLMFHIAWINILSNLFGISLMLLLYTKSIKKIIFVSSTIYLINMGCDTITILFASYNGRQQENPFYSVITVFFIFICELISERIISYRKNNDVVHSLPIITVPLISMMLIFFEIYIKTKPDFELVIISIGLLAINFLVLYLYNMLSKTFAQKYDNQILREKLKIYSNQIDIILQSNDEVKTLRHDMKHHLNELKLLAMKGNSVAIENYIDEMYDYIHNPNEIVSSGNLEIDSVLNYMLQKGRKDLLIVNTKIQIPESINHSFDIIVILGNLLENAIEASRQTDEKLLNVSIQLKQGVLKIEIENSFKLLSLKEKREKGRTSLLTTKKEKREHGIGLKSVQKIIEKYNGIIHIHKQNNRFHVELLLYISENKEALDERMD